MGRRSIFVVLGTAAAVAVLVLALTAGSASSSSKLRLKASSTGALKFNKKTLHARKGKVTIVMTNPSGSGLTHGIAVEGHGVDKDGKKVRPGHSSTVSATLKPGRYEFYCPVDGHKDAGMEGTLVVK
jgi:uncharacterized cupredoxin-like copper-binding protein